MKRSQIKKDKFQLYQESVQCPEREVRFLLRVYKGMRKKQPRKLREDFCGTGLLCSEWVRRVPGGRALGIDLDRFTLEYGRAHNVASLGKLSSRVRLACADVLEPPKFKADIVAAYNFSYFVFKSREVLRRYFSNVYGALPRTGLFFVDIYGGPDAQSVEETRTRQDGFTYVWDQAKYNPVTGETLCHIHFEFPDGTRMPRAFTYNWRLWTLPEVKDLLREVGFKTTDVYWEGTDHETGEGNGVFRLTKRGDDSESWIAYIVAGK